MITITTDFGYQDHYVAVMKGVILKINPEAKIVDITHAVRRHDIRHASYILRCILPYFSNAVHLFVVDPGVGTERRGIAAKLKTGWFVGPDNGILTFVQEEVEEVYEILAEEKSTTFHGRDVFAPAAARIEMGDFSMLKKIGKFVKFPYRRARRDGSIIRGEILHIDHFGNIITNIPQRMVKDAHFIQLENTKIRMVKSYGYARKGELIALINSEELLEISVNQAAASEKLSLKPGDSIEIELIP